jgi:threonine dehydratase
MCGGNIDTSTLGKVLERGLVSDGRLVRFACVVPDRPGGIAGVCNKIADVGASIKHIVHERAWLDQDSHCVLVDVECEVTDVKMGEALYDSISSSYVLRTANFGPASRPKVPARTTARRDEDANDLKNPVTSCDLFDEDCTSIYPEDE